MKLGGSLTLGDPIKYEIYDEFDGWKILCSDRLNEARKRLPKEFQSLAKMGKLVDISTTQLSGYFTGKSIPNLKNLKKICIYLQIPADYLLGLKIDPQ